MLDLVRWTAYDVIENVNGMHQWIHDKRTCLLKNMYQSINLAFGFLVQNCVVNMLFLINCFFLCPRDRRSGGILFLFCLSFCHSVLHPETLPLLITFEQWILELWYFTWIFPVIRPFRGYHYFLPCDLDLGVWPIFWTVSARALIFYTNIPCDKTFLWVPLF